MNIRQSIDRDTEIAVSLSSSHDYIQVHPGRVITKYQFSHLFSKAWVKSLTPANIISGFKSCGIYPFNLKAVLDHNPCMSTEDVNSKNNLNGEGRSIMQQDSGTQESSHHESTTDNSNIMSFTAEEEILFDTRYTEGYNLYDLRYIAWLKVHPEESCENFVSLIDHFPDATSPEVVPVSSGAGVSTPLEVIDQVIQSQNSPGDPIADLTPVHENITLVPTRLCASPLVSNLKSSNMPTSNNPATSPRITNADISTASSSTTSNISTPSSSTVNISTPSSSMAFSNFSTPSSSTADNISPPSSATVVNNAATPTSQAVVNNTSSSSSMSPNASYTSQF